MLYEIHLWGLYAVEFIQSRLNIFERLFLFMCSLGDPSQLYVVYFPVILPFFPALGLKILLASSVGEWLNILMKWLFKGERPYWWVEENHLKPQISIQQFYNTCETGPGTPSGHVMLTSIIYYVIVSDLIKIWKTRTKVNFILWFLYMSLIFLMGVSRTFIAAHFPHQCLLGFLSGLPVAKIISEINLNKFLFHHYAVTTCIFLGSVFGLEGILASLGIDINWSVKFAKKWCFKQSWVHIATSPHYVTWRSAGALFGMGLINYSTGCSRIIQGKFPVIHKILAVLSGVFLSNMMLLLISNISNNNFFLYSTIFMVYATIPYIVCMIIPKFVNLFYVKPVVP